MTHQRRTKRQRNERFVQTLGLLDVVHDLADGVRAPVGELGRHDIPDLLGLGQAIGIRLLGVLSGHLVCGIVCSSVQLQKYHGRCATSCSLTDPWDDAP